MAEAEVETVTEVFHTTVLVVQAVVGLEVVLSTRRLLWLEHQIQAEAEADMDVPHQHWPQVQEVRVL
jgi:hypothetical protein